MNETLSVSVEVRDCVDRLAAGDAAARDELIVHSCGRLEALARKMFRGGGRRSEDTAEVLQGAVRRLGQALAAVAPPSPRDYYRLAAGQIRRALIDLAGQAGPPVAEAGHLAAWAEFHTCVEQLPPDEREAFDLLWYAELTQPEAAELLGVIVRAVRQRWREARSRLIKVLGSQLPGVTAG
jgi:DNA-directed RNA polymerase specialized sigma24 family protein